MMSLIAVTCLIAGRSASAAVGADTRLIDFIKGPETNGMTLRSYETSLNIRLCVRTRLEYDDVSTTPPLPQGGAGKRNAHSFTYAGRIRSSRCQPTCRSAHLPPV